MDAYIQKGDWIRARWILAKPLGSYSLSSMQMKVAGDLIEITGTIKHFRGDHPTNPTMIRIYIDPDEPGLPTTKPEGCTCDHEHVEIDPKHVIGPA